MSDIVERLLRASPGCPCGGDPVAVRKTCPQYSRCTANADAADEIERLRARLAEAEKVIEPFAEIGKLIDKEPAGFLPHDEITLMFCPTDHYFDLSITHKQFHAALAWKEASNG